jgi:hypothetical protein
MGVKPPEPRLAGIEALALTFAFPRFLVILINSRIKGVHKGLTI